jgi:hypothetical protein
MTNGLISIAFEELSQSLRVLPEACFRAHAGGLLRVDRAEAVGNIETALGSILNSFHSLYDAIEKEVGAHPVDWYATAELATVLAIRNARHHNQANRIRTLYTYHVQESARPTDLETYLLIDFPSKDEGADTYDLYVSWKDFELLLSLPRSQTRLRPETCLLIRNYLGADRFGAYSRRFRLPKRKAFVNAIPLFVNAAAKVVPAIRHRINPSSTESRFFRDHFATVARADTGKPELHKFRFFLPE